MDQGDPIIQRPIPNATFARIANSAVPTVQTIANHKKLYRKIPYDSRQQWIQACKNYFIAYYHASSTDDDAGKVAAIAHLLQLPSLCLAKTRGGANGRWKRQLNKQLTAFISNQQAEARAPAQAQPSSDTSASASALASNIKRAVPLARDGYLAAAAKALTHTSVPVNVDDAKSLDVLSSLHPPCNAWLPRLPADSPTAVIQHTDKAFRKLIKDADNGSAPGLSGWTAHMVRVVMDDDDCARGLSKLITDISNGNVPPECKQYILSNKLVALPKVTGGIRPISIGEIFYRIAALRASRLAAPEASSVLKPIQYGIGVSGGCQMVIHKLQHLLEQASRPVAALAIDFANAFNTRNRDDIMKALYAEQSLSHIWRIVDFAYSAPSDLYTFTNGAWVPSLQSSQGVRQGDPLGSLLFALSVKQLYNKSVQGLDSLSAMAIHDDFTVVGEPEQVMQVFDRVCQLSDTTGLKVKAQKCQFIYFHGTAHPLAPSVTAQLHQHNIPIRDKAATVLGSVVGIDHNAMAQELDGIVNQQKTFFDAIVSDAMPVQEAMQLLRLCGVAKMDYIMQTVRPATASAAAVKFDSMVMNTAITKLALSSCTTAEIHSAQKQIRTPIRSGGFGLRSAYESMHAAWLSAHARTVQHDSRYWSLAARDATVGRNCTAGFHTTALGKQLVQSVNTVQKSSRDVQALFPMPAGDAAAPTFIRYFAAGHGKSLQLNHYQHLVTSAAFKATHNAHTQQLRSSDAASHARMLSICNKFAGRWMTMPAYNVELQLSDHVYRCAARMRLGLQPDTLIAPAVCKCGATYTPWHALTCVMCMGASITRRHNRVVQVIAEWCRRAGCVVTVEPTRLDHRNRERPDLHIIMHGAVILVDVTVVHPAAASNLSHAQVALGVADAAEKEKETKYQGVTAQHKAKFIAFACETFGAVGTSATRLLDAIGIAAQNSFGPWDEKEIKRGLIHSVASAIQSGNSMAVDDCLARNGASF